jgi:hypothetical protein
VALIFTFFLAGFAQWWLARVLGLGRVARLWSGAMAIAAGGIGGRMDDGVVAVVVSTVCCALVLPPAIQLSRDGKRRTAAVLAIPIALVLVAGQGYLQIGFAMLTSLFLIFILGNPIGVKLLVRRYALACALGAMIAAPFLVPFLHFYPSFAKWNDPTFGSTQSFTYVPFNLVIADLNVFTGQQLEALPYPYLYVNYLGWIAVVFAGIGCYALWRSQQIRLTCFLMSWSIGALWISSAMPLKWIRDLSSPGNPLYEFVIGMRFPSLIAGLAIPSVLGLSAIGVDRLIKHRPVGSSVRILLSSTAEATQLVRFNIRWLLVIPLVFALRDAYRFDEQFLRVTRQPIESMAPVLDALATDDAQWVDAPFGEEYWIGQALERNLKLSYIGRVWHWKARTDPTPVLQASRKGPPEGKILVTTAVDIGIYAPPPGNEYAAVTHADGTRTVCSAHGTGGNIDVTCDLAQPGRLEVKENYYSGWNAMINGQSHDVTSSTGSDFAIHGDSVEVADSSGWLSVELPAGKSTTEFRYRPWDVPVGIMLMLVGLAASGFCLVRREPQRAQAEERNVVDLVQPVPVGESAMAD